MFFATMTTTNTTAIAVVTRIIGSQSRAKSSPQHLRTIAIAWFTMASPYAARLNFSESSQHMLPTARFQNLPTGILFAARSRGRLSAIPGTFFSSMMWSQSSTLPPGSRCLIIFLGAAPVEHVRVEQRLRVLGDFLDHTRAWPQKQLQGIGETSTFADGYLASKSG
jgi:hypothetical protein